VQIEGNGFEVKYLVSDVWTGNEIAASFAQAIGKPKLLWTNILLNNQKKTCLPEELVGLIVEMRHGVRAGIITKYFTLAA
jgi:hypothetical protein